MTHAALDNSRQIAAAMVLGVVVVVVDDVAP